ncbi:AAC(3) family N-acetyltransferase [Candidatus Woesearchaeota archaeon]|nr:AAC(3) family N-acetyltransferase [Candidatus Woesearchaeota archaeon]
MDNKADSDALYYSNSTPITKNGIKNALLSLGVKKGDLVMVHSDIKPFGRLGTSDRDFLLQSLIDAIKESVGANGTIVMPTFTYSFFKNLPYDAKNSKSAVGVLTEYFRKQPDVGRTIHPTHCVAICGRHKNELLKPMARNMKMNSHCTASTSFFITL